MKGRITGLLTAVALGAALGAILAAAPAAAQERRPLTIATGSLTGLYYAAGNAICRVLERRADNTHDCRVVETGGSGDNLAMLRAGQADLALAQSDVLATLPGDDGRLALAALYPEVFQIVVRRELKLGLAVDVLSHPFNIGLPGSGSRATLVALMAGVGRSLDDFDAPAELSPAEDADAFCRGLIDGFIFVSGVPNSKISSVLENCGGDILGFDRKVIAPFVRARRGTDFYRFRRNTYPQMTETLDTFAVQALLVASPAMEDAAVRRILTALLDDVEWFARLHPAWADLLPPDMALNMEPEVMHPAAHDVFLERAIIGD